MKKPIPFGKYYLLDRISVGGMAEVFKAKTFGVEGFERLIAVKRILPSIAEDEEFITMFIDEAKIAVQLQHANIAQIFDLGKVGDSYFIAMEFVSGTDLRTIFERMRRSAGTVPIPMAVYIIMKACEGLDYAHNKKDASGRDLNLVHRDVSPQNLLVSYDGEVKIIDFGIAKAAGKAGKTQAGILKGKFGYMSPEQVRGLPLDRRSDIFAIGICLWEVLTGERLFVGESDFSTLEKVRNVEINPPTMYNSNIPEELEKIVLMVLSREVEDRYQSAMDLHDDLQSWMYTSGSFFARKDLGGFMHEVFHEEIDREHISVSEASGLEFSSPPSQHPSQSGLLPEGGPSKAPPPPPKPRHSVPPPTPASVARPTSSRVENRPTPQAPQAMQPRQDLRYPSPTIPSVPNAQKRTMLGIPAVTPGSPPAALGQPSVPVASAPPSVPVASAPPSHAAALGQPASPGPYSANTTPRVEAGAVSAPPPLQDGIAMDDWDDDEPPTNIYSKEAAAEMAQAAVAKEEAQKVLPSPPAAAMRIPESSGFRPSGAAPMSFEAPAPANKRPFVMALLVGLGAAAVVLTIVFLVFPLFSEMRGSLRLTVEPSDNLSILVDGVRTLPSTTSPFDIRDLDRGDHVITVKRLGFKEQRFIVEIDSVEPVKKKISLESAATGFFLETDPPGATVLVDNRPIDEKSPVTVTDLEPGIHLVRLTKGDAYAPTNIEVEVKAGEITELPKKVLTLKAVEITFESSPKGAIVTLINDKTAEVLGPAPISKVVDTDKQYKVKFALDGYDPASKEVEIEDGKETVTISETLVASAKPVRQTGKRPGKRPTGGGSASQSKSGGKSGGKPGTLTVGTTPWSKVYINGKFIKNTPLFNHSLKPGSYEVTVENPTYNIKKSFRVTIRSGKLTLVKKNLIL